MFYIVFEIKQPFGTDANIPFSPLNQISSNGFVFVLLLLLLVVV